MTSSEFINFINDNYDYIKNKISTVSKTKFNEDVFHDTIIKCYNLLIDDKINVPKESDALAYLYTAYKLNIYRYRLYSNNKPKLEIEETYKIYDNDSECKCDIALIFENLNKKFSKDIIEVYFEYVLGSSINHLQEKYKIKNLKYKFKNITAYIKNKWSE